MKNCFIILLSIVSFSALGQTQQNINKNTGTVSNVLTTIDSIRFNSSSTTMEVVLQNGTVESHSISDIQNVNFISASQHSCGAANVHNPNLNYGSMTDQEGNVYKTIVIGNQEWMAENLKTSIYRNGDPIATNLTDAEWQITHNDQLGAWAFYNNDSQFECPYGKLYNWYAVADPRQLCPVGWHIPADAEWTTLTDYLGGEDVAGGKMKTIGVQFWSIPNAYANNESGFSGLSGGWRYELGTFIPNALFGQWWSSSKFDSSSTYCRYLSYIENSASQGASNLRRGMHARCLRDETYIGATLPIVSTNYIAIVNSTGSNSAVGGGYIISDGDAPVTQRGICWNTIPNPTISNNRTLEGSGTGSFTSNILNFAPNTTYYVRAYAINSVGISYGNQQSFTTLNASPNSCGAPNVHNSNLNYGSLTDQEGNVYKTIVIGSQKWMAENLKTSIYRNGDLIPNITDNLQFEYLSTGAWSYFNNDILYECPFGKLYNWYAVTDPRHVCPIGWHEPTDGDWTTLLDYLGGDSLAGGKMKTTGLQYWNSPNLDATNESGFSGLPGSYKGLYGLDYFGDYGTFWSSSEYNTNDAWSRFLDKNNSYINRNLKDKNFGMSVRCINDVTSTTLPIITTNSITSITGSFSVGGGNITWDGGAAISQRGICWSTSPNPNITNNSTSDGSGAGSFISNLTGLTANTTYYVRAYAINSVGTSYGNQHCFTTISLSPHSCGASNVHNPNLNYGSMTDQEGNVYKTIVIGDQEWMAENLKTSIYRNGDPIATNLTSTEWGNTNNTQLGAWAFYNNDSQFECPYGKLYNGYAISDPRHVCPTGWHEPKDDEWTTLTDYVCCQTVSGNKMKTSGVQYWNSPNNNATNESGFSGLPGGQRNINGLYGTIGFSGFWWSSTENGTSPPTVHGLYNSSGGFFIQFTSDLRPGLSVRCLRDITNSGSTLPIITTNSIEIVNSTGSSAVGGGNITSDGGANVTQRGVCWSTNPNPTTSDNTSIDGSGLGSFTSNITSLTANTTYFVRAYAINGVGTAYGNQESFTTLIASQHSCGATNVHNPNLNYGSMTDQEGNVYKTIVIGTQEWMAENLKTSIYRNGEPIATNLTSSEWYNGSLGAWMYYNNDSLYECPYGKLYNSSAVADPRQVCPAGWHIPVDAEWTTLISYLGGDIVAGGKMKTTGIQYWINTNNIVTNESGFSALPGGASVPLSLNDFNFDFIGAYGYWWSTSTLGAGTWVRQLSFAGSDVSRISAAFRNGFSARCLRGESTIGAIRPTITSSSIASITGSSAIGGGNITSNGGAAVTQRGVCWSTSPNPTTLDNISIDGTGSGSFTSNLTGLTANTTYYVRAYAINSAGTAYGNEQAFVTTNFDIIIVSNPGTGVSYNGYLYSSVVLGNGQEWMSENLRTANYRNGDPISTGLDNATWSTTTSGAYAFYNNDVANNNSYGKLYNFYAVADPRHVCPTGWHEPTDADWNELIVYLDPFYNPNINGVQSSIAGGKMKKTGLQYWINLNQDATNESGFSGVPGGNRLNNGTYGYIGYYGYWWSSSSYSASNAWMRGLYYNVSDEGRYNFPKNYGFSVRCLKDGPPTGSTIPIITTSPIILGLIGSSAVGGGNITSDGGAPVTQRGVCWSPNPNPTIINNHTIDGSGAGSFISNLTGLFASNTYYVRAYAINSLGIAYGNQQIFTTLNLRQHSCGADSVHNPNLNYGSMTDQEGNVYKTIVIGDQEWMAENLKTSIYRNGDPIATNLTNTQWTNTPNSQLGAWAYFNNDSQFECPYGKLYNWYAVTDPRHVCPISWHEPTDSEWTILIEYLGGEALAGGGMKTTGSQYWISQTGAYNESGFSGLPGGAKGFDGSYTSNGFGGIWLSNTESNANEVWLRYLTNYDGNAYRVSQNKRLGFSVRCLKD